MHQHRKYVYQFFAHRNTIGKHYFNSMQAHTHKHIQKISRRKILFKHWIWRLTSRNYPLGQTPCHEHQQEQVYSSAALMQVCSSLQLSFNLDLICTASPGGTGWCWVTRAEAPEEVRHRAGRANTPPCRRPGQVKKV